MRLGAILITGAPPPMPLVGPDAQMQQEIESGAINWNPECGYYTGAFCNPGSAIGPAASAQPAVAPSGRISPSPSAPAPIPAPAKLTPQSLVRTSPDITAVFEPQPVPCSSWQSFNSTIEDHPAIAVAVLAGLYLLLRKRGR